MTQEHAICKLISVGSYIFFVIDDTKLSAFIGDMVTDLIESTDETIDTEKCHAASDKWMIVDDLLKQLGIVR